MQNTDFDRRFNRMRTFTLIWFGFIAVVILTVFAVFGYTLFHPELIGEFFGRIVRGFNGAA
jgi:hypothetical protein